VAFGFGDEQKHCMAFNEMNDTNGRRKLMHLKEMEDHFKRQQKSKPAS
jgi:hypothetical protein